MLKILLLIFLVASSVSAKKSSEVKEVRTVGIVQVSDRQGNLFTGQPIQLMVSVINDSEYVYYVIEKPDDIFFKNIGKRVEFSGKAYVKTIIIAPKSKYDPDSLTQDTLHKNLVEIKDYNFLKDEK